MNETPPYPIPAAWPEEALVPVSALQYFAYCPRQCAQTHVEQAWTENLHTLRGGRRAHERVDDVVEFLVDGTPDGMPFPVEHKVGPRRAQRAETEKRVADVRALFEGHHLPAPVADAISLPSGRLMIESSEPSR